LYKNIISFYRLQPFGIYYPTIVQPYFLADKHNKLITSDFVLAFFPSLKKGTKNENQ